MVFRRRIAVEITCLVVLLFALHIVTPAQRVRGQEVYECMMDLKSLGRACYEYIHSSGGLLPPDLRTAAAAAYGDPHVHTHCPQCKDEYRYPFATAKRSVSDLGEPAAVVIAYCAHPHTHDDYGGPVHPVMSLDGRVVLVPDGKMQRTLSAVGTD